MAGIGPGIPRDEELGRISRVVGGIEPTTGREAPLPFFPPSYPENSPEKQRPRSSTTFSLTPPSSSSPDVLLSLSLFLVDTSPANGRFRERTLMHMYNRGTIGVKVESAIPISWTDGTSWHGNSALDIVSWLKRAYVDWQKPRDLLL